MIEFHKFSKIPRLNRDMIITEKLDGTNAQICVVGQREIDEWVNGPETADWVYEFGNRASVHVEDSSPFSKDYCLFAGSRNRWISTADDNHGFAKWVRQNKQDLATLGVGLHFGEYWGQGVQRNYGLKEKRFSLFNVSRWENPLERPNCCHCVPVLYEGPFDTDVIEQSVGNLAHTGSKAVPGFMDPEGVVVFHKAANSMFKVTCKNDEVPKGSKEVR